jgi:sugar/nucleoside kinase (ribokinase family)
MTLIDQDRAKELYEKMGQTTQVSGGSAANTMAGIASFGGKGTFIGLVANDQLGDIFTHDIHGLGLKYNTSPHIEGKETARCYVFITPDGERSMNTFLGACTELASHHIDHILVSEAAVTYMEGYLFDKDPAKDAFYKAAEIAHNAGREVALTLSDSFCVKRHKDDFLHLVENKIDILFGNKPELCTLFDTDDIDDAFSQASEKCKVVVSTRGSSGAMISLNGDNTFVHAVQDVNVKDLTGAGDQFAAGFLYGYTKGKDMITCGELAARAAAEVISHVGPRPHIEYSSFVD